MTDIQILEKNWTFSRDNRNWATVSVPHDWAITGPFARNNDLQKVLIVQNGEQHPSAHSGRTGGLPHTGKGFYRREFTLNALKGHRFYLDFDGAMSHSHVTINGIDCGGHAYGYTGFRLDITHAVKRGINQLAVALDNPPLASRWYPGAGLYRKVALTTTGMIHFDQWGVYARWDGEKYLELELTVCNHSGKSAKLPIVCDLPGVGHLETEALLPPGVSTVCRRMEVAGFARWTISSPQCYPLTATLGGDLDAATVSIGFRTIAFSPERGFELNGESLKIQGVCNHHDLGPLGAAFQLDAARRQLEIMREMGCNAIRTSHNPPAPELLDLCDEMGFLVMDEAFDTWEAGKNKNDYSQEFNRDHEADLTAMVRRDRNHPSIILWSIGNEIPDQCNLHGAAIAKRLVRLFKSLDDRPTCAGFDRSDAAIANGLAEAVDVPSWNYKPHRYREYQAKLPHKPMFGSETLSVLSSRGVYRFPASEQQWGHKLPDMQVPGFDLFIPPWANLRETEFEMQREMPGFAGQFIWTGFDYLGEPTPYDDEWPSRSSYFGCVDLVGLEKDRFYGVQAEWRHDIDVLHLLPHWTWPGHEGDLLDVHAYTNADEVELFLNGVSQGVRTITADAPELQERFRCRWQVIYAPGELKAVARRNGKVVGTEIVRTAGKPVRLVLMREKRRLEAAKGDLAFVRVHLEDADGNFCPTANPMVEFRVKGPLAYLAADAGDAASVEPFHTQRCRLFSGRAVVYLGSIPGRTGTAELTAATPGMPDTTLPIEVR